MLEIIVKYIKVAAAVIGTLYISKYVAQAVLSNQHVEVAILVVGVIVLIRLSDRVKFILLSICVFIPFYFPIRVARKLLCIELLAPIFCFYIMTDLLINKRQLFYRKTAVFHFAILVLLIWSLVNYSMNPVGGAMFGAANVTEGGLRAYFSIFVGFTIFYSCYWFFIYKKIEADNLMISLALVAFIIGYLRMIGYFYNFGLRLIGGNFTYAPEIEAFTRVGGLTEAAALGITVLLAYGYARQRSKLVLVWMASFFILLVVAGGRAQFFAIALVMFIYNAIINKEKIIPLTALFLILGSLYLLFYSHITLPEQAQRLIDIQGKLSYEYGREETFMQFIDIFLERPVFGKGLGFTEAELATGKISFFTQQAVLGGHGAYLSMLATFGIGGIFFLLVMIFGGMCYAYRIIKDKAATNREIRLALFGFFYLVSLSVVCFTSYAGYNIMELYYVTGMIAGIASREEVKGIESQ